MSVARALRAAALASIVALASLAVPAPVARAHGRYPEIGLISFHPRNPDVVAMRGTFGLLLSQDGGGTFRWICHTVIGARQTEDPSLVVGGDGSLVVGFFDGLARGSPDGCDWGFPSPSLTNVVVIDVARHPTDPDTIYALTSSGGMENGLYRSTDDGATWTAVAPAIDPILFETMRIAPSDPDRIYLTGAYPPMASEPPDGGTGDGGPPTPRRVYTYRSSDGGETWESFELMEFGQMGDRNGYLLGVDPLDSNRLFMYVRNEEDDRVYESTDGGESYAQRLTMRRVDGFAWSDDGSTVWIGGKNELVDGVPALTGLRRSTDGGHVFTTLHDDVSVGCLATHGDELWICADNFRDGFALARSTDRGQTIRAVLRVPRDPRARVVQRRHRHGGHLHARGRGPRIRPRAPVRRRPSLTRRIGTDAVVARRRNRRRGRDGRRDGRGRARDGRRWRVRVSRDGRLAFRRRSGARPPRHLASAPAVSLLTAPRVASILMPRPADRLRSARRRRG